MKGKKIQDLTQEQEKAYNKLTSLQQRVIYYILRENKSDYAAYRAAGGRAKSESSARATVSELLVNPKVKAFMDSVNKGRMKGAIATREEILEKLTGIIRVEQKKESNDPFEDLGTYRHSHDVQLKAVKQFVDMTGMNAPQEIKSTVNQINYDSDDYKQAQDILESELGDLDE